MQPPETEPTILFLSSTTSWLPTGRGEERDHYRFEGGRQLLFGFVNERTTFISMSGRVEAP